jgi:glycosyltransferase involved in cell wall biosynthesis
MDRILWLEPDRFDIKPNKSPWLEMAKALRRVGFEVVLVTGYAKKPYKPGDANIRVVTLAAVNLSFIFRYSLLLHILLWTLRNGGKDDIIILNPATLLLTPVLRLFGFENLHLDIRTLPLRANKSLKKRIDRFIFWTIPLVIFHRWVKGYSFITDRLRSAVEEELDTTFKDYVIWQSGVNTRLFRPINLNKNEAPDNRYRIFYHGSIYGNRGVDTAVQAIALLRPEYRHQIHLTVVGPMLGNINLAEIIAQRGLSDSVTIEGLTPTEEIPEKIAQSDCCICPLPDLLEWNVSSPLKVFEYMACGKPVILTPIPAHRDVAEGLDFIAWAKGYSAEHLCDAIENAFEQREQLSKAATSQAVAFVRTRYDWEIQGQKLASYLRSKFMPSG